MGNRRIIGILVAGATLAAVFAFWMRTPRSPKATSALTQEAAESVARAYLALEAKEQEFDQTSSIIMLVSLTAVDMFNIGVLCCVF